MFTDIPLLPAQWGFVRSTCPSVLYSGAAGAGKSRALCCKVALHAAMPDNVVGLFRKSRSALKATTLKTLLEPDGPLAPILPVGTYTHNKQEGVVSLHGGGQIIYMGFDDELRLGSLNLGMVAIDEAIELTEDEWNMLLTRPRNLADPYRQVVAATNPGTPSHFLYKTFFSGREGTEVFQTRTTDNPFLPPDYLKRLEGLKGATYKRLVLGLWVAHEGLIFGELEVAAREGPWQSLEVGVDAGYHHPHAVLLGFPAYGAPHVLQEIRGDKWTEVTFAGRINRLWGDMDVDRLSVDPSAPSLVDTLLKLDLPAMPASNDVLAGISSVLTQEPTISPRCTVLASERLSYRWHEGITKEQPFKEADHGCDALRYCLYSHALSDMNMEVSYAPKERIDDVAL